MVRSHWTTLRTIPIPRPTTIIMGSNVTRRTLHTALRPCHWCHWLLLVISLVSLHISFSVSLSVNIPSLLHHLIRFHLLHVSPRHCTANVTFQYVRKINTFKTSKWNILLSFQRNKTSSLLRFIIRQSWYFTFLWFGIWYHLNSFRVICILKEDHLLSMSMPIKMKDKQWAIVVSTSLYFQT